MSTLLLLTLAVLPQSDHGAGRLSVFVGPPSKPQYAGDVYSTRANDDGQLAPFPLPLVTRSEVVRRVVPSSRGVELRLEAQDYPSIDLVELVVIEHDVDEQVLVVEGVPHLVGPPRLPARATGRRGGIAYDLLPLIARQDGLIWKHDIVLQRSAQSVAGEKLVVLTGARTAQILDPVTRYPSTSVDHLFYATAEQIDAMSGTRLELLGATADDAHWEPVGAESDLRLAMSSRDDVACRLTGTVDLRFDSPPLTSEGRTATLLLQVHTSGWQWPATTDFGTPRPPSKDWFPHELESSSVVHFEGPDLQLDIRPTMGPGIAFGDVDQDGDQDLYVVQGGGREGSDAPTNRLFENRSEPGRIEFTDVTSRAGAADRGRGMGALFFDVEGDHDLDLYVANYGADAFYLNDGMSRFENASESAGVGGNYWSAGIAAGDTDLDGDLDVYVTSYLVYDLEQMTGAGERARYQREDPVEMLPFAFPGERNTFLRNDTFQREGDDLVRGNVRFSDVTEELGLGDTAGRGMQPVFWDFDRDGDLDLYIANDVSFNVLYRNEGDGTFRDVSFASGMDDPRGGMGVALGDVDADGDEDLFLTNWELEPNALYLNNQVAHASRKSRVATFRDAIVKSGLGAFGVGATSWGCELFDADLDGDLDLFVANGYTSPDYESTGICVGQPNHFFLGDGAGRFESAHATPAFEEELASRAAVACDVDSDGDLDLVVTANNGPLRLFENRLERLGHWLGVRLAARGANPFGIGAEVRVLLEDGTELVRTLRAGTSYLAGNPAELHFGLGDVDSVTALLVRWPSGTESRHAVTELDRFLLLEEPE